MKLSEILKDWPEKMTEGTGHPFVVYGFNAALTSCDREIDREAMGKLLYDEFCNAMSWENVDINTRVMFLEHADKIISTMPTWLKPTERK